jgi:hypothetical protein
MNDERDVLRVDSDVHDTSRLAEASRVARASKVIDNSSPTALTEYAVPLTGNHLWHYLRIKLLRDASMLDDGIAACVTRCCLKNIIYKDDSDYLDRENKQVVSDQFRVYFVISQHKPEACKVEMNNQSNCSLDALDL